MSPTFILFAAFALGVVSGLRSLTGPAVIAWAARLGWIDLGATHLSFFGTTPAVVIFTVLAAFELVTDKLPKTPPRTAPAGLIARIVLGALSGAAVAAAGGQQFAIGAVLGALGGVVGAFGGYQIRTRIVKALGVQDFYVAVSEDVLAILIALALVTHLKL